MDMYSYTCTHVSMEWLEKLMEIPEATIPDCGTNSPQQSCKLHIIKIN